MLLVAKPPTGARSENLVKSATRVVELFEFLDEWQQPVTVTMVARALGYPQSSASALLKSLSSLGYLQHDQKNRSFMPTDRIALLGSSVCPGVFGGSRLQSTVWNVVERCGFDVAVGARHRNRVQYVYVCHGEFDLPVRLKAGLEHRLVPSATGMALLSQSTDEEIRQAFHRINAYAPLDGVVNVRALLEEVDEVRLRGYAIASEGLIQGLTAIAVTIPSQDLTRQLALVAAGPTEEAQARQAEIADILREEVRVFTGENGKSVAIDDEEGQVRAAVL